MENWGDFTENEVFGLIWAKDVGLACFGLQFLFYILFNTFLSAFHPARKSLDAAVRPLTAQSSSRLLLLPVSSSSLAVTWKERKVMNVFEAYRRWYFWCSVMGSIVNDVTPIFTWEIPPPNVFCDVLLKLPTKKSDRQLWSRSKLKTKIMKVVSCWQIFFQHI